MNYEHLRGWRDICEYLNSCWYKFAEVHELYRNCGKELNQALWLPEGRLLRQQLWDTFLIHFIRWGEHPILYYRDSRRNRRAYRRDRGWTLVYAWEAKIDFLEQVVLLDRDPQTLHKPWQPEILRRIEDREQEEAERLRQHNEVLAWHDEEKRKVLMKERLLSGLCPHCAVPLAVLMMDCPNCRKSYEEIG